MNNENILQMFPERFLSGHNLCFLIHDILVQLLKSGESSGAFLTRIQITKKDEVDLDNYENIFEWLDEKGNIEDKINILRATVLQAVLSDALHCIYEALKSSQKGKLNITYMLVRKPIQESLYLIESIFLDDNSFCNSISKNPLILRPKNAGGIDNHIRRVSEVIALLGGESRLNGDYIARLRYDKNVEDNFDGICNLAMHLFTEHKAIRTEALNVNFIFSDSKAKLTQWSYLYSRLPYLLFYFYILVEGVMAKVAKTPEIYLDDMQRRISSGICLWWEDLDDDYRSDDLFNFYQSSKLWLDTHCRFNGYEEPSKDDLKRMMITGAFPNESSESVDNRYNDFISTSKSNC